MRKSKTKNEIYFADFETTTPSSKQFQDEGHTNVYLWNISPISSDTHVSGETIEQFFEWLEHDLMSKVVYFHNLSFDGNFIFKWLIRNKPHFFYQETLDKKRKYNYFKVFRKNNKFYSIEYVVRKKVNNKKHLFAIKFMCSYNLIPSSIESLGKAFGLNKMNEDDIDWLLQNNYIKNKNDFYHLGGSWIWNDSQVLSIYKKYIENDCRIAKTAWLYYRDVVERNNPDAYNSKYNKKSIYLQNILTSATLTQKLVKNHIYNSIKIPKEIKKQYRLKQNIDYNFAHKFYSGGFSQYNINYHNKIFQENGVCIDINSSYPWAMTKLLPYGGLQDTKPNGDYLTYVVVDCSFEIRKKYEHFPCIKDLSRINRYAKVGSGTYYWLEDEYILLQKMYKFKINSIKYYYAHAYTYLKSFIDKYYQFKVEASHAKNEPMKNTYKLLLNSLYGGFGKKASYPELIFVDEDLYMKLKTKEQDSILGSKYQLRPQSFSNLKISELNLHAINFDVMKEIKDYPNLLVGATITSYSRIKLIEAILAIGINNFIYCDTDSIFFKWNKSLTELPKEVELDEDKLGAWKIEFKFSKGKILGSKRYVFGSEFNGKIKMGSCGIKKVPSSDFDVIEKLLNGGNLIPEARLQRREDDWGVFLEDKDIMLKIGKQ